MGTMRRVRNIGPAGSQRSRPETRGLRLLAVVALLGLLALIATAPSVLGATKHHNAKRFLKCDVVLPVDQIKTAIVRETGIGPKVTSLPVSTSKYSAWADGPGGLRGANIHTSGCFYDWTYKGNAAAYNPDLTAAGGNVPNIIVWVGSPNVTLREWDNIKAAEAKAPGTDTDAIADYPYQPQRAIALGDKSKAFVESFVEDAPPGNRYTTYYGLYVYSKHHDLLTFWGWPLSLAAEESIVKHQLVANRF
jgi:hypothetical protein